MPTSHPSSLVCGGTADLVRKIVRTRDSRPPATAVPPVAMPSFVRNELSHDHPPCGATSGDVVRRPRDLDRHACSWRSHRPAAAIVTTVPLGTAANYPVAGVLDRHQHRPVRHQRRQRRPLAGTIDHRLRSSYPATGSSPAASPTPRAPPRHAQGDGHERIHQRPEPERHETLAVDLGNTPGGLPLQGGVYDSTSHGALGLTGTLVLDGGGNANTVFIFQSGSTLTTASNSVVQLINGAQECNVFWQLDSSATLGTGSVFVGNILAHDAVTVTSGVTVHGRAFASTAAVTLDTDVFAEPTCALSSRRRHLRRDGLPGGSGARRRSRRWHRNDPSRRRNGDDRSRCRHTDAARHSSRRPGRAPDCAARPVPEELRCPAPASRGFPMLFAACSGRAALGGTFRAVASVQPAGSNDPTDVSRCRLARTSGIATIALIVAMTACGGSAQQTRHAPRDRGDDHDNSPAPHAGPQGTIRPGRTHQARSRASAPARSKVPLLLEIPKLR